MRWMQFSRAKIAIVAAVALHSLSPGGRYRAYAYDTTQKDKIADGVTIGGVDVGGMDEAEADRGGAPPAARSFASFSRVGYDGDRWALSGKSLKVHAEIDKAVEGALADSQDGGFPGRLVRYVTGGNLDKQIPADVTYSQPAINRFVRRSHRRSTAKRRTRRSNRTRTRSRSCRPRTAASCATSCSLARSRRRC